MSNKKEIIEYLEKFARAKPSAVVNRLSRGSKLMKGLNLGYEIDNINADEILGVFPIGAIPYRVIHNVLRSNSFEIMALFKGSEFIPFSKVMKAGVGQCLEKSILVQLAAQRAESSYLISGALELDNERGADFHAFNLVVRGDGVYLVDVENPISKDKKGNVLSPYVVPVKEITATGNISVPEEYRAGRTYSLD